MIFTPVGMIMLVPVDPEGKTIAWGMTGQVEDQGSRASWLDYAQSPKVKESVKLDHSSVETQPIRGLVDRMDDHDIKVWPHYRIPELDTWFTARTCLIGDAAHAMPPNGQGIAIALEDGALMARLLSYRPTQPEPEPDSAFSTYTPQFTLFQTKRQTRLAQILASSKLRNQATTKSGPWVWALKQWIFSALFWWKGGAIRPGWVGDYDVEMEDVRWGG
jgi:2-polyprenyl-6-methoxyphenol hydroxylase-like FAD-dependent oxidoreductase